MQCYANQHRLTSRRSIIFQWVLAGLLLALTGCSTTQFRPANPTEKFPPFEGEVKVLEQLPPAGQYRHVGVVMVEGVTFTKQSRMMNAIKKEAAAQGANAVVFQSSKVKTSVNASGGEQKRIAAWAILLRR